MAIAIPPRDAVVVPSTVLAASDLTRQYGEADAAVHALRGVSIGIPEGHGRHVLGPARRHHRVRDRRDAGRHAGGDPARPPSVAAERVEGAAVRVDDNPGAPRPACSCLWPARARARPCSQSALIAPAHRGRLVRPAPAGDVGGRPPRRRPGAPGPARAGRNHAGVPAARVPGGAPLLALLLGLFGLGTAAEAWHYVARGRRVRRRLHRAARHPRRPAACSAVGVVTLWRSRQLGRGRTCHAPLRAARALHRRRGRAGRRRPWSSTRSSPRYRT